MFKRLSKSRRHSADEVGCSLPAAGSASLDESPGRRSSSGRSLEIQALNNALLRVSRNKYSRRSCGDAPALQSLLASGDERSPSSDYQTVTAVPAFIVEHEPEKAPQKGLGITWGRRMSKKIESFRRSGSRESMCSPIERTDRLDIAANNNNNDNTSNNNNNNNDRVTCADVGEANKKAIAASNRGEKLTEMKRCEGKGEKKVSSGNTYRSASPFKSFFIRMGSTGMLNSARNGNCVNVNGKKNRGRSENADERLTTSDNLFRSCSTSHLNADPTYVKGDDPSDGIDLRIGHRSRDKTMSCDDLAARRTDDDVFVLDEDPFRVCDAPSGRNETIGKTTIGLTKESKKCNFPYAFLRSKLSVLPEERQQLNSGKEERLIKATSEEHLPNLKLEESYEGATTLGRRATPRSGGAYRRDNEYRYFRNSYAEPNLPDYTLDSGQTCNRQIRQDNTNETRLGVLADSRFVESSTLPFDLDFAASLRKQRRNSAPSAERRLSSQYVSSNESGYDSDGPRAESTVTSENENPAATRFPDGSDTSSVPDSDIEKPPRTSTPGEHRERTDSVNATSFPLDCRDEVNGARLRWHRSASGRILPSIDHRESCGNEEIKDSGVFGDERGNAFLAPHRARLQNDKTRFLSDIVDPPSPPERIRRFRLVQLEKKDARESLGIRLARPHTGEPRYIVVQLENGGIAHRDGRLRLGDEIVRVEGRDLKTMDGLAVVQEFLRSFAGNEVRLVTAYDETLPRGFNDLEYEDEDEDEDEDARRNDALGCHANSSETMKRYDASITNVEPKSDVVRMRKRPDNLAVASCLHDANRRSSLAIADNIALEPQQYVTRHVAKFQKGYGKPSLGFSVVGGRDSPRGEMGIFVRRVFPGGQADVTKSLFQGDEILSLNGKILRGYTHREVIELFKAVREGPVELDLVRRHRYTKTPATSAPY